MSLESGLEEFVEITGDAKENRYEISLPAREKFDKLMGDDELSEGKELSKTRDNTANYFAKYYEQLFGEDRADSLNMSDTSDSPEKGNPIQNKIDGLQREAEVKEDLEEKYPPEEGYEIISEAYLRDADGNIVKDPETGKARRIDFVVVKDGKVIDSIEVTSKTADKSDQLAKENRIREFGGNYIRDNNGNLIKIPSSVQTRVERRD